MDSGAPIGAPGGALPTCRSRGDQCSQPCAGTTPACHRAIAAILPTAAAIWGVGCLNNASDLELLDCEVREERRSDPESGSCALASALLSSPDSPGCIAQTSFDANTDCLVLDADAELCPGDTSFDIEVRLSANDAVLDCRGQVIEHAEASRWRSGIRAPYERSLSGVTIRNCKIRNTREYGIDLKRFFRGPDLSYPLKGHRAITVDNVEITGTGAIGIYVGQNSRDVVIENTIITDTFAGIYIESGALRTRVSGAEISGSRDKAAIHIDSAQDSVIESSRFRDNANGGILLYKNCGERYGQVCPIRRPLGASQNVIRFNHFDGDRVSVADRQFKTYAADWCEGIELLGRWRDRATDNSIHSNEFVDGAVLDLQDSGNHATENTFHAAILEIGAPDPLGDDPVRFSGTISGNYFGADSWIAVVGDSELALADVVVENNRDPDGACYAEYRPVVSCPAQTSSDCHGDPTPIEGARCDPP